MQTTTATREAREPFRTRHDRPEPQEGCFNASGSCRCRHKRVSRRNGSCCRAVGRRSQDDHLEGPDGWIRMIGRSSCRRRWAVRPGRAEGNSRHHSPRSCGERHPWSHRGWVCPGERRSPGVHQPERPGPLAHPQSPRRVCGWSAAWSRCWPQVECRGEPHRNHDDGHQSHSQPVWRLLRCNARRWGERPVRMGQTCKIGRAHV